MSECSDFVVCSAKRDVRAWTLYSLPLCYLPPFCYFFFALRGANCVLRFLSECIVGLPSTQYSSTLATCTIVVAISVHRDSICTLSSFFHSTSSIRLRVTLPCRVLPCSPASLILCRVFSMRSVGPDTDMISFLPILFTGNVFGAALNVTTPKQRNVVDGRRFLLVSLLTSSPWVCCIRINDNTTHLFVHVRRAVGGLGVLIYLHCLFFLSLLLS